MVVVGGRDVFGDNLVGEWKVHRTTCQFCQRFLKESLMLNICEAMGFWGPVVLAS